MKRGIFGGRFDPFHTGHLNIIQWCFEQGLLDHIEIIPAANPVHKPIQSDYGSRKKQIQTAICSFSEKVSINDIEWHRRDTPSWMIDTVTSIQKQYPQDELYLIMGSDTLIDLPRWYQSQALQNSIKLIVFNRPTHPIPSLTTWASHHIKAPIHWVHESNWPQSSTQLRRKTHYVLGITGRMGSGKTTASNLLHTAYGVPMIELDHLGHLVLKKPDIQSQLSTYFGALQRTETGDINRLWLGELVFSNPTHLRQLNQVMHPHIRQCCIEQIRLSDSHITIVTGALLYEIGLIETCDHIWVIDAPDTQLESRLGPKFHRLLSQMSRAEYLALGMPIPNHSRVEFESLILQAFKKQCEEWQIPCTYTSHLSMQKRKNILD